MTGSGYMNGGDGNDTKIGSGRFDGGLGNDTYVSNNYNASTEFYGGDGIDTVYYNRHSFGVLVNIGKDRLHNRAGDDLLGETGRKTQSTDKLVDVENVVGTDHNDTIVGSAADNGLYGGRGSDEIYGRDGNDFINPGGANTAYEYVETGDGYDTIYLGDFGETYTRQIDTDWGSLVQPSALAGTAYSAAYLSFLYTPVGLGAGVVLSLIHI